MLESSGEGLRRVQSGIGGRGVSRCGECESKVRRNGRFNAGWGIRLVYVDIDTEVNLRETQYAEHEVLCGVRKECWRAGESAKCHFIPSVATGRGQSSTNGPSLRGTMKRQDGERQSGMNADTMRHLMDEHGMH